MMARDTVMAVNMDAVRLIPRVRAKPLMAPVPIPNRITQVMSEVMLESAMVEKARSKPR